MEVTSLSAPNFTMTVELVQVEKEFSSAAVEGLNNQARVVTRRSYGFRTFPVLKVALFHTLGKLPEPELTHRFR